MRSDLWVHQLASPQHNPCGVTYLRIVLPIAVRDRPTIPLRGKTWTCLVGLPYGRGNPLGRSSYIPVTWFIPLAALGGHPFHWLLNSSRKPKSPDPFEVPLLRTQFAFALLTLFPSVSSKRSDASTLPYDSDFCSRRRLQQQRVG